MLRNRNVYSHSRLQDFDGGPCCVQFGCMLQRGYYPTAYEDKLSGTFIISSAHDVLAGFQLSKLGTYEVLTQATTDTHQMFSEAFSFEDT